MLSGAIRGGLQATDVYNRNHDQANQETIWLRHYYVTDGANKRMPHWGLITQAQGDSFVPEKHCTCAFWGLEQEKVYRLTWHPSMPYCNTVNAGGWPSRRGWSNYQWARRCGWSRQRWCRCARQFRGLRGLLTKPRRAQLLFRFRVYKDCEASKNQGNMNEAYS